MPLGVVRNYTNIFSSKTWREAFFSTVYFMYNILVEISKNRLHIMVDTPETTRNRELWSLYMYYSYARVLWGALFTLTSKLSGREQ